MIPPDRTDDPGVDFDFPDPRDYDAVLVLGARWSVYSDQVASWVKPELELLRTADESGVPVFGICFGGQMLAHAHGGEVVASPVPEIGPHVVSGVPAVAGVWTQWHHDRFVPPADATVVGVNAAAPQAFVLRRNLAVQFHPEVDADSVRRTGSRTEAPRTPATTGSTRTCCWSTSPPSTRTSESGRPRSSTTSSTTWRPPDAARASSSRTRSSWTPRLHRPEPPVLNHQSQQPGGTP